MRNKIALLLICMCTISNVTSVAAAPYAGVEKAIVDSTHTPTAGVTRQLGIVVKDHATQQPNTAPTVTESAPVDIQGQLLYNIDLSDDLQDFTRDMCVKYNIVDYYDLILKQMYQESKYQPGLISSTCDYGLMQINICNHKWLRDAVGLQDMLDSKENIEAGVYIMSGYLQKYGNVHMALMCYNLGEDGAQRCWSKDIWTTEYSRDIVDSTILEGGER